MASVHWVLIPYLTSAFYSTHRFVVLSGECVWRCLDSVGNAFTNEAFSNQEWNHYARNHHLSVQILWCNVAHGIEFTYKSILCRRSLSVTENGFFFFFNVQIFQQLFRIRIHLVTIYVGILWIFSLFLSTWKNSFISFDSFLESWRTYQQLPVFFIYFFIPACSWLVSYLFSTVSLCVINGTGLSLQCWEDVLSSMKDFYLYNFA